MGARKGELVTCSGCGADVSFGPASCPLCGGEVTEQRGRRRKKKPPTVDAYQADLRKLREELDELRERSA